MGDNIIEPKILSVKDFKFNGPDDLVPGSRYTEIKEAEQNRLSLERQILHKQKLESLGLLSGSIAHDFNNVLMSIIGNAELALDHIPDDNPAKNYLNETIKRAKHAADLSQQMLAYSGKGKFHLQRANLNDIILDMKDLLTSSQSKKAIVEYELTENLPAIMADVTQVRQIILNLITNASEALENTNGLITVRSGIDHFDKEWISQDLHALELQPGDYVWLSVRDTGCGMDEKTLAKIFDPFFTTKFTGRGLGLAAIQGIVRAHSGAIRVQSKKHVGSEFTVILPAVKEKADSLKEEVEIDAEAWSGSGTILVVDDDVSVRSVVGMMLQQTGLTVLSAEDGCEAIKVFKENSETIDCVLLDLTMPGMDGREVFLELRNMREDVPIIISSGFCEQEVGEDISEQSEDFLKKPYSRNTLLSKVKRAMEKK